MDLKKIWYILTFVSILALTFYLGFLYGFREDLNRSPDNIEVVGPNLARQNSLSNIQTIPIQGSTNSQDISNFGQLYFNQNTNSTEILILLENIPNNITSPETDQTQAIPQQLGLYTATRTKDSLDYEYELIGTIYLDEPIDNRRTGRFPTIINAPLTNFERLVIRDLENPEANLFTDQNPDLPPRVRDRPAPYFWIIL